MRTRHVGSAGNIKGWFGGLVAAMVVLAVFAAHGDQVFKDDFNRAELGANYVTNGTGGNAGIVDGKLKVDMAGVSANLGFGMSTVTSLVRSNFTAGSFFKADALYHNLRQTRFAQGGYGVYYRYGSPPTQAMTAGQNGYWAPGDTVGGSTEIWSDAERNFVVLHIGDPNGDGSNTVHTFLRGVSNKAGDETTWRHNTSFTATNIFRPDMRYVTMAGQHRILGTADNYCTFDNLVIYNRELEAGGAVAIKSALVLGYSDDFNRTAASIGPDWTITTTGTSTWSCALANNRVEVKLTTVGGAYDQHAAKLALTNATVLGRGMIVGEYAEIDLYRGNTTPYFGAGGGLRARFASGGASKQLSTYRVPFGSDQTSGEKAISEVSFTVNAWFTLGWRLDYADGDFMVLSYYVNGAYAGSWLAGSTAKKLNVVDLFSQANNTTYTCYYDNLRIYVTPPPRGTMVSIQ